MTQPEIILTKDNIPTIIEHGNQIPVKIDLVHLPQFIGMNIQPAYLINGHLDTNNIFMQHNAVQPANNMSQTIYNHGQTQQEIVEGHYDCMLPNDAFHSSTPAPTPTPAPEQNLYQEMDLVNDILKEANEIKEHEQVIQITPVVRNTTPLPGEKFDYLVGPNLVSEKVEVKNNYKYELRIKENDMEVNVHANLFGGKQDAYQDTNIPEKEILTGSEVFVGLTLGASLNIVALQHFTKEVENMVFPVETKQVNMLTKRNKIVLLTELSKALKNNANLFDILESLNNSVSSKTYEDEPDLSDFYFNLDTLLLAKVKTIFAFNKETSFVLNTIFRDAFMEAEEDIPGISLLTLLNAITQMKNPSEFRPYKLMAEMVSNIITITLKGLVESLDVIEDDVDDILCKTIAEKAGSEDDFNFCTVSVTIPEKIIVTRDKMVGLELNNSNSRQILRVTKESVPNLFMLLSRVREEKVNDVEIGGTTTYLINNMKKYAYITSFEDRNVFLIKRIDGDNTMVYS